MHFWSKAKVVPELVGSTRHTHPGESGKESGKKKREFGQGMLGATGRGPWAVLGVTNSTGCCSAVMLLSPDLLHVVERPVQLKVAEGNKRCISSGTTEERWCCSTPHTSSAGAPATHLRSQ